MLISLVSFKVILCFELGFDFIYFFNLANWNPKWNPKWNQPANESTWLFNITKWNWHNQKWNQQK